MNISTKYPQLYFRFALGTGFIILVMDRLGFIGRFGQKLISWGDWNHFIGSTAILMPYLSRPLVGIIAFIATFFEVLFGICLVIGFKTRLAAYGSFILTLLFGLSMALFLGYKAPLNFSVFPCSAGSLLLASLTDYEWSMDQFLANRKSTN